MSETVMVAAVTEAGSAETAVEEELIPLEQEITDPFSKTEEESIPTSASPLPVTVTEEHVEPKQAESVSSGEEAITNSEEASVSGEEDILESTMEITPTEPVMVQPSPMEGVTSSVEADVQNISPAPDAVSAASETTSEIITAAEETQSETAATRNIATEDVPVSTSLTVDTNGTESIATGEMPVYEELGTDIISSEEPLITIAAAEETCVTEELVSEPAPLDVPVEELISFENTASLVLDEPVQVQTFPDLALDPLLDPLGDTTQVLKPVAAQEQEQEEQSTGLPVKPEDNLEPAAPLQADLAVLSPGAAPAEGNIAEQEACVEGAEDPAEDLEAELNEVKIHF